MKNSIKSRSKRRLVSKWNKIELDFKKKYHILNYKITQFEGGFDQLLESLHEQTGIRKRELKREILTWDSDISDMYNF